MNVSLMFVFNGNFYFETRLFKPNGKNARKRRKYCSMDIIYFPRIICYMITSVYILKPGAEKQANVLKRYDTQFHSIIVNFLVHPGPISTRTGGVKNVSV